MPDWNWVLSDGTGDRAFTQHISFGEDLSEVPVIVLGISGLYCTVLPCPGGCRCEERYHSGL